MNTRLIFPVALLVALIGACSQFAAPVPVRRPGSSGSGDLDWPCWRGPTFDGKSRCRNAPTGWGAARNVLWKTPVPGKGHSSPVLSRDRVFLTTADDAAGTQSVLAFERKTGKPLWATVAHKGNLGRKHPKNSHASATPACDGRRVYSAFHNGTGLHVTATGHDGKILWQTQAGAVQTVHGSGSSPVLYRHLVAVTGDGANAGFVAALDRASGKVVWKAERKPAGKLGGYSTPVVAKLAGKDQLVVVGMGEVAAYEPLTGKRLWWCKGPSQVAVSTPAFSDRLVFASGGFPEKALMAVRADGSGDVSNTHVAWRSKGATAYVPSPLCHDGLLYVLNDNGQLTCFEAASGKQVWQERLAGAFTSSPVLAGGRIYATNEAGKAFVFEAGRKYVQVAANELGEGVLSTPAIGGGRIYVRASGSLYCIGK